MGAGIIDLSRGSGIESMTIGEPLLQTSPDGSFPWVGMFVMVDSEHGTGLDFTGFEPTLDNIQKVYAQGESGRTLQELHDNTRKMYRIMFERGRDEIEHPWLVAKANESSPIYNLANLKILIWPQQVKKVDQNDKASRVNNYG